MEEPIKPAPKTEMELQLARAKREKEQFYSEKKWFAVYVQPLHEFQINDYLLGIEEQTKKTRRGKPKREDLNVTIDPAKVKMECYVPVIRQRIKYSDRYIWKEKIQTPGIIFVHTDLNHRDPLFHSPISEYVSGFLNDHVKHRPQPIPDSQMELFKQMVESEYAFTIAAPSFTIGQKVLVLEGPLKGHVAELVNTKEVISRKEYETDRWGKQILDGEGNPVPKHKTMLSIRLNSLLAANFEIDADKVAIAPANAPDFEAQD